MGLVGLQVTSGYNLIPLANASGIGQKKLRPDLAEAILFVKV